MYDRYTIFSDRDKIESSFKASVPESYRPNYNAAPTQLLPVITMNTPGAVQFYHWGLPDQMAHNKEISPKLFNLPVNNVLSRPVYKKLFDTNRCIILSNGFYLWKRVGKKKMVPYFCYIENYDLFAIGGIWDKYEDLDGNSKCIFNMITTEAKNNVMSYKDDLPLILTLDKVNLWLAENTPAEELQMILNEKVTRELSLHSVNPKIADFEINNKDLIKPTLPADQFGNYTLFS